MKKLKTESKSKAKILHLPKKQKKEDPSRSSEVARSLFSETWRCYLDEVNMVNVKMKETKDVHVDKSKGPVRLSLLS